MPEITRRTLLFGTAAYAAANPPPRSTSTEIAVSARLGDEFRPEEFGFVGVFGLDWLLDPQFGRLLDIIAASPGGIRGVRTFGVLSGGRDGTFPTVSADLWDRADAPPDFDRALAALDALVSRRLTPFLPLTFFPPAVSAKVTEPPGDLGPWQTLVRAFLDAAVARFGAAEVGRWWFEVWNEPNMPSFWLGSFDRYLDLYRATSDAVVRSGHAVRLGGPVLAYTPEEGPALMERFLAFLRDAPQVKCDFISYHRKGVWNNDEGEPDLRRLVAAAEDTAAAVQRLIPDHARGLTLVNDEADMKVGFDTPYPPRMTAQFPSWLAASMIAHDRLSREHANLGVRFVAAADNANLQLARAPFDGRRMLTTPLSPSPADQVKYPVLAFYELLRLLGDRRGSDGAAPDGVSHMVTAGASGVAILLTRFAAVGAVEIECVVQDLPWPRVNVVQFRIDEAHANPTRGGADAGRMRQAQELGALAPPRVGVRLVGPLRERVPLGPYATALVWITPHDAKPSAAPAWLEASREGGNVVLRWTPDPAPSFYSFELARARGRTQAIRISPDPLRAAMWIDTGAPDGPLRYAVRAVSASGVRGPASWSRSV